MATRTCFTTPTRTVYDVQTIIRAAQTQYVTEVIPIPPSIQTNIVTTRTCNTRPNRSGSTCRPMTVTERTPVAGSSSTRVQTIRRGLGTTILSRPVTTIYRTSCSTRTTRLGVKPSMSSSSEPRTLASEEPTVTGSKRRLNVGAVVGGLLGGFLAPIILVILVRMLLKRRRSRRTPYTPPQPEMRSVSVFGGGSRAVSPATTLYRSPTSSSHGHHARSFNPNDPASLDRRISKTSRMSRTSYEPRGGASPPGSSHGHGEPAYVTRRPSGSSHGHGDPVYVSRRPSGYFQASHPPVAYGGSRAASPVGFSQAGIIKPPSPVLVARRTVSPVGSIAYRERAHSPVQSYSIVNMPVYDPRGGGGGGSGGGGSVVGTPPQEQAPTYVAGAPLASVDEHSPHLEGDYEHQQLNNDSSNTFVHTDEIPSIPPRETLDTQERTSRSEHHSDHARTS